MDLNETTYKEELKSAFKQQSWDECANSFATATDNYIKTGTVGTIVNGVISLPSGGTSSGEL